MLSGNYAFSLTGRQFSSSGTFINVVQSNGVANFDGDKNVSFRVSTNSNQTTSSQQTYNGTYTLPSNCLGTLAATIASGKTANYSLAVYNGGKAFLVSGTEDMYVLAGGGVLQPGSCLISTLSGVYAFNAHGFSIASNSVTGVDELTGLLQLDGGGNITANWNITSGAATSAVTASGTYSLTNGCLYSAMLTDSSNAVYQLSISVTNATGADFDLNGAAPQGIFSGNAHSSFANPGQSVANAASFKPGSSPPGTIFSIFGHDLASGIMQASSVPLPKTLLSTTVMINGVPAPLFYVSPSQINAQVPVGTPLGLATIIVKNGNIASNAAAFKVPETAPGIFTFTQDGQTRAVVQNPDSRVNTSSTPARVGDVLVGYFTGGGPVRNHGLQTGTPAPNALSPVEGNSSVKVSSKLASVTYVGLTPGFIGLYQVNFQVPRGASGDHPVVLSVGGQASNAPLISVSN